MSVNTLASAAAVALVALAPLSAEAQGAPLGGLFACAAPGSANTTDAVVGGLAGAAVGSQVSKNERALGAVIGAGPGAMAGNYIGCRMDANNRVRAETAVRAALETGRTQTWRDPRTGAQVRVEVIATEPAWDGGRGDRWRDGGRNSGRDREDRRGGEAGRDDYRGRDDERGHDDDRRRRDDDNAPRAGSDLRYARGAQAVSARMEAASPRQQAERGSQLRAGPYGDARIVGSVRAGETLDVAGATRGWLLMTRNREVVGYLPAAAARPQQDRRYAGRGDRNCRTVQRRSISVANGPRSGGSKRVATRGALGRSRPSVRRLGGGSVCPPPRAFHLASLRC